MRWRSSRRRSATALCPLAARRTLTVPGESNVLSDVMLVGEGPGAREDATGRPFVGPAGQLLDELLHAIGWAREHVFITNVVKCRPPGNRDPEPEEIAACRPYLDRQEAALDPAVIVTLGRHSLRRYLPDARIGEVHGRLRRSGGRFVFPMYHPAAALHQASLRTRCSTTFVACPARCWRRVRHSVTSASHPVQSDAAAAAVPPRRLRPTRPNR